MHNYFSLLSLPVSFTLDLPDLEKHYFEAQRKFHPDRLIGKNPAERQSAIAQSMLANEAYEALKNPLKRAQHLLSLQGIAQDSMKPSQELLMEILELRETLNETRTKDGVEKLSLAAEAAKKHTLKALLQAFTDSDIHVAGEYTMRLGYLMKLEDEIRIRKKTLA